MTSPAVNGLAFWAGCWLVGSTTLLTASPGHTQPWGRPVYTPPPVASPPPLPARQLQSPVGASRSSWAPIASGPDTIYDNDPSNWGLTAAQLAQRCNLGRLVGGLIGGGVGYGSSRKEGRSWAVPLGALLGSQVGCNVGAGRAPVPW